MSSAPFLSDLKDFYKTYVGSPSKQLNMGWTLTSWLYTFAVFLGLILVLAAFVIMFAAEKYRTGGESKLPLLILAYIGIGMVLFGVFMTTNNFASVTSRIDASVRADGDCSLFAPDTADNTAIQIASAANKEENTRMLVDSLRRQQSRAVAGATGGTSGRATSKSLNIGSLLRAKKQEAETAIRSAAAARSVAASGSVGSAGLPVTSASSGSPSSGFGGLGGI